MYLNPMEAIDLFTETKSLIEDVNVEVADEEEYLRYYSETTRRLLREGRIIFKARMG